MLLLCSCCSKQYLWLARKRKREVLSEDEEVSETEMNALKKKADDDFLDDMIMPEDTTGAVSYACMSIKLIPPMYYTGQGYIYI